jgi:predicted RNase H-like nuclease (RuvC/YqgF family)
MRTREMDDAQGSYNHEDEIKGLHISLGNVETESNGHRSRVEYVKLAKTMKRLQREVKSYKEENERLIRAQKEQNQINTQLRQSLNNLRRQPNKYSGTKHATTSISHDR